MAHGVRQLPPPFPLTTGWPCSEVEWACFGNAAAQPRGGAVACLGVGDEEVYGYDAGGVRVRTMAYKYGERG
eukprot:5276184-Alexandrium_andersonii.AAC.1